MSSAADQLLLLWQSVLCVSVELGTTDRDGLFLDAESAGCCCAVLVVVDCHWMRPTELVLDQ